MSFNLDSIRTEYPFEPKTLDIGGRRLSYLDEGPKDGKAILLLHGNPTWSFYYRRLVLALRDQYRVIVPDHMGCGLSDKPQDYDYTLENHIENLDRLVHELGLESVTMGVHDWGGAIGFGWATKHPRAVRSLIVFNTAAFRSARIPFRIWLCRLPLVGEIAVRGMNAFVGAAVTLSMATEKKERFTQEVSRGYLEPYGSWADRVAIHRFVKDIPLSPADESYETITRVEQGLSQFRGAPMTIIWGMRDWCFDTVFLDEWVARFPAADVHRFEDAGHFVVEDTHERIAPIVRGHMEAAR